MYGSRRAGYLLALAMTTALGSAAPVLAQATAVDERLDARLERLCDQLEERRVDLQVPGMAIAVVLNDEIVLARGFGIADVETQRPVTDETIFAIGSSTKAMTATLVGILVDEGRMDWDDPITKHLPYFELAIDSDDEDHATVRDLLSHRSGFARMGILWAAGRVPREEVLHAATAAEPFAPFRAGFNYNNVMFLAVGVASGKVAGSTWDELMHSRLLDPLGMDDASTTISVAQKDDRLALGYRWDEDLEEFVHLPMRNLDTIAPAGAVNAHVRDMAQWVRLQLGNGAIDGRRLVSEDVIAETRTPTTRIAGDVHYGLGWMLRDWKGQPEVEHGGNIDGFAAQVSLLPEAQLGYVLLMNVTASPLQNLSKGLVWNAILGEDESAGEGDDEHDDELDLDDYVGLYIANFGPFRDERFAVSIVDGALAVDVPGQTNYVLRPPNDEGMWPFDLMPEQIQVSFDTNDDGAVVGMKMYQAGLTFELPREGVEIAAEVDAAEVDKYLGSYRFEEMNAEVEVLIQNGRLALDVPGQMVFELHPPDEAGRRAFRAIDGVFVTFADDGSSLTLDQAGQAFELPRVGAPVAAELPDLDAFIDRVRAGADDAVSDTWRLRATTTFKNAGVSGEVDVVTDGLGRYRSDTTLGRFGEIHIALDGERSWADSTFAPFQELLGNMLVQVREGHPLTVVADWRDVWETVELRRVDEIDDRAVIVIRTRTGDAPTTTFYVDRETGDVLRAEGAQIAPGIGPMPVSIEFSDYREIGGVRFPHRIETRSEGTGRVVTEFTAIERGVDVSGVTFELTETK